MGQRHVHLEEAVIVALRQALFLALAAQRLGVAGAAFGEAPEGVGEEAGVKDGRRRRLAPRRVGKAGRPRKGAQQGRRHVAFQDFWSSENS